MAETMPNCCLRAIGICFGTPCSSPRLAGTPTLIGTERPPMPRDHGCRFDHDKGRTPRGPHLGQGYPKDSFLGLHVDALLAAGIGSKLLSQGKILDPFGALGQFRFTRARDGVCSPKKHQRENRLWGATLPGWKRNLCLACEFMVVHQKSGVPQRLGRRVKAAPNWQPGGGWVSDGEIRR